LLGRDVRRHRLASTTAANDLGYLTALETRVRCGRKIPVPRSSPAVLRKVLVRNYRAFKKFKLELSPGVNIIVGNNDAGKSTLLEAINLALTARLHGYPIGSELTPHLFNQETTQQYVHDLRRGRRPTAPEIIIELYLDNAPRHAGLVGENNLLGEDCPGVRLKIVLDEDLRDGYQAYIADPEKVALIPTEYYTYKWLDFGGNPIKNTRHLPDASLIDASTIRLQTGTDYFIRAVISERFTRTVGQP